VSPFFIYLSSSHSLAGKADTIFVCYSLIRVLFNDLAGSDEDLLRGIFPAFVCSMGRLSLFDDG
jgi:hypothetical protein